MGKKVLILTGGGMRCAWSGGFLYGLHECGIRPDTIVASSGSIGSATYFASGQVESIKRVWTEHLPGNRFINFSRFWKIIDIDYLVDDIMHAREPFDWDSVRTSNVQLLFPVHAVDTKGMRLFTNTDVSYETMRAGKALPIFYRKKILIDGMYYQDYFYPEHQLLSFAPHCSSVLFLDTGWKNIFAKLIRRLIYRNTVQTTTSEHIVKFVRPHMRAFLLTSSQQVLEETFNDGRRYVHEHKDFLTTFFEK